jgi:hypothetical protein
MSGLRKPIASAACIALAVGGTGLTGCGNDPPDAEPASQEESQQEMEEALEEAQEQAEDDIANPSY